MNGEQDNATEQNDVQTLQRLLAADASSVGSNATLIKVFIGGLAFAIVLCTIVSIVAIRAVKVMSEAYTRNTDSIILARSNMESANAWEQLSPSQKRERLQDQYFQIVRYYTTNVAPNQKLNDDQIMSTFNSLWETTSRVNSVNFFLPIAYMKVKTNFNPAFGNGYQYGIAGFYYKEADQAANLNRVKTDPAFQVKGRRRARRHRGPRPRRGQALGKCGAGAEGRRDRVALGCLRARWNSRRYPQRARKRRDDHRPSAALLLGRRPDPAGLQAREPASGPPARRRRVPGLHGRRRGLGPLRRARRFGARRVGQPQSHLRPRHGARGQRLGIQDRPRVGPPPPCPRATPPLRRRRSAERARRGRPLRRRRPVARNRRRPVRSCRVGRHRHALSALGRKMARGRLEGPRSPRRRHRPRRGLEDWQPGLHGDSRDAQARPLQSRDRRKRRGLPRRRTRIGVREGEDQRGGGRGRRGSRGGGFRRRHALIGYLTPRKVRHGPRRPRSSLSSATGFLTVGWTPAMKATHTATRAKAAV